MIRSQRFASHTLAARHGLHKIMLSILACHIRCSHSFPFRRVWRTFSRASPPEPPPRLRSQARPPPPPLAPVAVAVPVAAVTDRAVGSGDLVAQEQVTTSALTPTDAISQHMTTHNVPLSQIPAALEERLLAGTALSRIHLSVCVCVCVCVCVSVPICIPHSCWCCLPMSAAAATSCIS